MEVLDKHLLNIIAIWRLALSREARGKWIGVGSCRLCAFEIARKLPFEKRFGSSKKGAPGRAKNV